MTYDTNDTVYVKLSIDAIEATEEVKTVIYKSQLLAEKEELLRQAAKIDAMLKNFE